MLTRRRAVPGWALASAVLAPVGMIGGWTLAAAQQQSFDPVRETISALAAAPSTAPWTMTAGLALTGVSHCVTAAGLASARPAGRAVLALAGVATAGVAAFPVDRSPQAHGLTAAVAFAALTAWPALASHADVDGALSRRVGLTATAALAVALVWFGIELQQLAPDAGAATGLAERVLAGAQSLWPLAVVVLLRARSPRVLPPPSDRSRVPVGKGS